MQSRKYTCRASKGKEENHLLYGLGAVSSVQFHQQITYSSGYLKFSFTLDCIDSVRMSTLILLVKRIKPQDAIKNDECKV